MSIALCDLCDQPAIDCVGGTDYFCAEHQSEVVDQHAASLSNSPITEV